MTNRIAIRAGLIVLLTALALLLTIIPTHSALAATEDVEKPERLHFVNAIDTNVYSERLAHEVFKRMGIDVSFTLEEMNVCLRGVDAGIYDGIGSQAFGIEKNFDQLVPVPFETSIVSFYALTLNEDPFVCTSWDDFSGMRVGSLTGKTVIMNSLPDDIAEHTEVASMSLLYDSLRSGDCDVVVISESSYKTAAQIVTPYDIKVAGTAQILPCGIFLNKKYANLVDEAVQVLEEMEKDGSLARIKAMKTVEERDEKVVLYLSSYSPEMQWEQRLMQGISNVLNQETDIKFYNISLNSFRNTNVDLRETEALKDISSSFIHTPPDAVIVSDNEAMDFLLSNYNSILPNDIPVVACGLNNISRITFGQPDRVPNISGIVESISAAKTVEEMLELFPSTEEIYVINDYTLTGRSWQNEIETQLEPFADRVHVTYNENTPFDDLITHVSSLDENTLILCGSYWLDSTDHYYPQAATQSSLYNAASVPIFGLLDDSQAYGQLGGMYTNAVLHGELAATYLVDMMRADSFGQISYIEPEEDNEWVFNWDVMQQYGISKSQLPEGATALNAPLSLEETDPVLFYTIIVSGIAAAIVIVLLIIFTVALQRRNKRLVLAEADIRKSHDEIESVKNHLQTILKNAPIAYSLLVDDVIVESNDYYRENIGSADDRDNSIKYIAGSEYDKRLKECQEKGFVNNIYLNVTTASGEKIRYLYNIVRTEHEGREAIAMWGANVEQLEQQKEALNRAHRDIQELTEKTMTDSLTGLYTREASRNFVDEYIYVASETDISAFMIVDLDDFKSINDTFGHPYGDKVLIETAEAMKKTFRKSDVMIRIGGDEFAVFLKSIPNREFALGKADKLIKSLRTLSEKENVGDYISASIGISFSPENGDTFDALYQEADNALYQAKSSGKNQYAISSGTVGSE